MRLWRLSWIRACFEGSPAHSVLIRLILCVITGHMLTISLLLIESKELIVMHKLSSKRQITLPKVLCDQLSIDPGDFVEIFEHNGRITVVKKQRGSSKGSLRHLKAKLNISDDESIQDALANA